MCASGVVPASATADTGDLYFQTPWGTRCQVSAKYVACDTCEPGLLLDTAYGAANCGKGPENDQHITNAAGAELNSPVPDILGPSPDIQQLVPGQTYHANGWTIAMPVSASGVHFTNDATGHGLAVAPQNRHWY